MSLIRLMTVLGMIGLGALACTGGALLLDWQYGEFAKPHVSMTGGQMSQAGVSPLQASALALVKERLHEEPTSGGYWLWLAELRYAAEAGQADKAGFHEAFRMSCVTAPNESRVMFGRAILGIRAWNALKPEEKDQVLEDIIKLSPRIRYDALYFVQQALASDTAQEQQEIKSGLIRFGAEAPFIGLLRFPKDLPDDNSAQPAGPGAQ